MNQEYLEFLRENTLLTPVCKLKVMNARKQAEKFRDLYVTLNPSDKIGVDYSTADELEYQYRLNNLQKKLEKGWKKYALVENDGLGLLEFTESYVEQKVQDKIKNQNHMGHKSK